MISSIYNTNIILHKSGSRKGKSKKAIENKEKKVIEAYKRLKLKDKKMAKDRFSKFKSSNYKRNNLNKVQIEWLENLRLKLKKRPSINFINSILEQGYVPTKLQKEIIKTIVKNG